MTKDNEKRIFPHATDCKSSWYEIVSCLDGTCEANRFGVHKHDHVTHGFDESRCSCHVAEIDRLRSCMANWQHMAQEAEHKSGIAARDERIRELEQQLAHATQMAILATQRAEQSESRERILSEQLEEVHRALDAEVTYTHATAAALNNEIQKGEERADKLEQQLKAAQDKVANYEAEYIQPMFDMAYSEGIDLQQLVLDNPGKTCTVLLTEGLVKQLKAAKERLADAEHTLRGYADLRFHSAKEYFAKHAKERG